MYDRDFKLNILLEKFKFCIISSKVLLSNNESAKKWFVEVEDS